MIVAVIIQTVKFSKVIHFKLVNFMIHKLNSIKLTKKDTNDFILKISTPCWLKARALEPDSQCSILAPPYPCSVILDKLFIELSVPKSFIYK